MKMIKDEIIDEENFAKLLKVLKEKFERAKSCCFRGCKSQESFWILEHLEIFLQKISKFRKTINSNFSEGIVQTSLKRFNAERRIE